MPGREGDVHYYASMEVDRDADLAALLSEVLDRADGIGASFFEVTTAAAFLAFARTPAAATIVEVGLGGRLDATNVIAEPAVTGIAALGMDHEAFLGDRLVDIAGEKAGIAKRGVPLVTMNYAAPLRARIAAVAAAAGARIYARNAAWHSETAKGTMRYRDGGLDLVTHRPRLVGPHQSRNLALAIAMLRHQGAIVLPEAATGIAATAVFCFITAWNEYAFALILTNRNAQTAPPFIPAQLGSGITDWTTIAAGTVLFLLPVAIFTFALRGHLLRGVTFGAIRK